MYAVLSLKRREYAHERFLRQVLYHLGVAQPGVKLDSQQLRQLKQRIGLRCALKPLNSDELKGYIVTRLHLAGANSRAASIFPDETIAFIYNFSRGIPRLVNTLCENSLLLGFWHTQRQISWEIVLEVATDLGLDISPDMSFGTPSDGKNAARRVSSE